MGLAQTLGDVFSLPEGEGTFAGSDAQGIGGHDLV